MAYSKIIVKKGFRRKSLEALIFLWCRRPDSTTSLKTLDFTDLLPDLLSAFRPVSPCQIWGLGVKR